MSMVIDLRNLPRPWENIDAKTLRGTDSMFVKQLFSYPSVIQFWNRLVEKVRSFIETVLDVQRKLGAKAAPSKQKPDNHKNSLRGSNASGHTTRVKKIRNIIAIGCRSGHHRSVAFVERLAIYLQQSINHKSTNNNGMMITNTNNNTGIPASASGGCGNSTSVSQLPRSLCHTSSLSTAKSGCNEWELLPAKNTAPRLPLGNIDIKIEHRDIDRDPTQELHLRKGLQPFALTCKPCQVHTSSTVSWNLHIMSKGHYRKALGLKKKRRGRSNKISSNNVSENKKRRNISEKNQTHAHINKNERSANFDDNKLQQINSHQGQSAIKRTKTKDGE